jgi:hypothetical protein
VQKSDTNSDSKIERGDEGHPQAGTRTEAYISVRRGDDNEVNEVKSMKANSYYSIALVTGAWLATRKYVKTLPLLPLLRLRIEYMAFSMNLRIIYCNG